MNYLNQYNKVTSLNNMHQNHFSNQTNQISRFHNSTPTIVDRIVFPQMVNDVR